MTLENRTEIESAKSIDPQEGAFYERLAHAWWDTEGPFWPIHTLNALRVQYVAEQIAAHFRKPAGQDALNGLRVLDVGCGGGVLSESIARLGAEVVGIDVADRNLRVAGLHADRSGLEVQYGRATAEQLAAGGDRFDVVLNMEVVEHVADLEAFTAACSALVRPGGMMFIATINRTPLAWLTAVLGAEYVLRWLPRGTHHWRKLRKPEEVTALLGRGGLRVIDSTGVLVNPLSRRMRFSRFTGINYMLTAVKRADRSALRPV